MNQTLTLALAAAMALPAAAPGQVRPAVPSIAFIYPAGAKRGTTVELAVSGVAIRGATAVRISGAGVRGKVLPPEKTDPKQAAKKKPQTTEDRAEETIRVSLAVAPDAAPGRRELRVVTPGGVSNRLWFVVGAVEEVAEKEPNSRRAQAQPLAGLPVVVNGQIFSADRDLFRFKARAGTTLVCRADAQGLLPFIPDAVPGWFQAILVLYDHGGRELAYVDDWRFHPDPVLIYRVPKDGEYTLEIRDAIFRGRGDFVYRLHVGAGPWISHVWPPGGRRGSTVKPALFGSNLPTDSLTLQLTGSCPPVRFLTVAKDGLSSNAAAFGVDDLPEYVESERNDSPADADAVSPPVTINGRIDRPGDVDFFAFDAKAKQHIVFDVRARRLGSPVDSHLAVLNAQGRELVQNDDTLDDAEQLLTHHADSRVAYTFPADGRYLLRIEDAQGRGGPEFTYRIAVAPPRPDFLLRVLPDNPRIAPGETAMLLADAVRRDGFNGPITLAVAALPKGFVVRGADIPAGKKESRFTITAPADASAALLRPTVTGTAKIAGRDVTRTATPAEEIQQAFSYKHRVPTGELLLPVVEPGPLALAVAAPPGGVLDIPQGGSAKLTVRLARRRLPSAPKPAPKAKGKPAPPAKGKPAPKAAPKPAPTPPVKIAAETPTKGITVQGATIPAGKAEATVTVRVQKNIAVGFRENIVLTGSMKVGKETITAHAPAVTLRVFDPKAKPPPRPAPKPPAKPAPKPQEKKPSPPKPAAKPKAPAKPAAKPAPKPQEKKPSPPKPAAKPKAPAKPPAKPAPKPEENKPSPPKPAAKPKAPAKPPAKPAPGPQAKKPAPARPAASGESGGG